MSAPWIVDLANKVKRLRRRRDHLRARIQAEGERDLSFDRGEASALDAALAALEHLRAQHAATTALVLVRDLVAPIVECFRQPDWFQIRAVIGRSTLEHRFRHYNAASWSPWSPVHRECRDNLVILPGRVVEPDVADLDPAARGPIRGTPATAELPAIRDLEGP